MARRSDHTRDEIRNMTIKAGTAIIAENGYNAFSARKAARAIGYTVGTLYNVFDNHDDIIMHINAATLDDMYSIIVNQHDASLPCIDAIKQLALLYMHFAETHAHRWNALFAHIMPADRPLPDWYQERLNRLFTLVETPLTSLCHDEADRVRNAKIIWASIHGICMLGLTDKLHMPDTISLDSMIHDSIECYIRGLTAS